MDSKVLKGALVGFGQVAEKAHAPSFVGHPDFQIVAVADETAPRRDAARSVFPDAKIYSTMEELLAGEKDLDFADIATPPFLHGKQALSALERGLHVLCEKPLTLDPGEFAALRGKAAEVNRALFTVHNWANSAQWRKIFELADSGAVGEVRQIELNVLRTRPAAGAGGGDWRADPRLAGGGILVDHGWHNLYLLYRLIRKQPASITASLPRERTAEDEAKVSLDFAGATARLHLSWRAQARSNTAVIRATRGTIELDDDSLVLSPVGGSSQKTVFPEKLSAGSAHPAWFKAMLADFKTAVDSSAGRAGNLDEAEFCLKTIHAAYRTRRAVPA